MSDPSSRAAALHRFAENALAGPPRSIAPASADASFRSYWRVIDAQERAWIAMDAPPGKEDIGRWIDIAARLRAAGVHAPEVHAADPAQGFILMEDLGTRTYLPELDAANADALYGDALDTLVRMQLHVDTSNLPAYDAALLISELERMPEWFLARHCGHVPDAGERRVIDGAFAFLAHAALDQPQSFVHRDFHSRNLLIVAATPASAAVRGPGVIDFQDAVTGPIAYDLVSLLRDCYIEWDNERVDGWLESHRLRLLSARLIGFKTDPTCFRRWFDLVGLQRHLKVLGNFTRLWYRDGKAQYLADLPLVWRYVLGVAPRYPELAALVDLLERACAGRDLAQPRAQTPA